MDMDAKTLGNHVLLSRRDLGMTQEELADRVGVSRAYVTNIEQGRAKNVGIDVVFGLARVLDVTVPYLLGLSENPIDEGPVSLHENAVTYEVSDPADRRLVQQVIEAFMVLSPQNRRFAVTMLRSMRQIEREDNDPLAPRIIE